MKLTIVGFAEEKRCDNCNRDTATFHVRCEAGTIDAELCAKCLARQCRMREKAKANGTEVSSRPLTERGAA
jgi:hypothetical protein